MGDKPKEALLEFKKGLDSYITKDFKKINETSFYVTGTKTNTYHMVNMKEWFCSCESFNHNGYCCKHMFFIMIEFSIKNGKSISKIKKINKFEIFNFMKESRKYFTKNEMLIEMINLQDFPTTIGEDSFITYYSFKVF